MYIAIWHAAPVSSSDQAHSSGATHRGTSGAQGKYSELMTERIVLDNLGEATDMMRCFLIRDRLPSFSHGYH
jgi:hypothetical protein